VNRGIGGLSHCDLTAIIAGSIANGGGQLNPVGVPLQGAV